MNAIAAAATSPIDPSQAIGQIAVQLPGATAVFRRLKLDFCCGGQVSLRQAAGDKGLDLQAVVDELSALQRPNTLPDAGTPSELVDHIVARYHDVHRAQLPELIRMARRVEAVHRDNPNTPHGLADALEAMEQERDEAQNPDASEVQPDAPADEPQPEEVPAEEAPVAKVRNASTVESPTRRVWAIADELHAANPDVRRKDIMAACEAAGIAFFTARTQIQKWMKAKKEGATE